MLEHLVGFYTNNHGNKPVSITVFIYLLSNLVSWPRNLSCTHSFLEMDIREYEKIFQYRRVRMQDSAVKFYFEMLCWTYSGGTCTKGKLGISFPKQNSLSDTATLRTKQATEIRYFILIIMGRDHQPTSTLNMRTVRYSSKCVLSANGNLFLNLSVVTLRVPEIHTGMPYHTRNLEM